MVLVFLGSMIFCFFLSFDFFLLLRIFDISRKVL